MMIDLKLVLLAALGILALRTQTPPDPRIEDVLKTLRAYTEAVRTFDVKTLDELFDEQYVEVSPLGEVDAREKTLSFYKTPSPMKPDEIKVVEPQIRFPSKDVAVAVFQEDVIFATPQGKRTMSFRATAVLRKNAKGWKLFSMQAVALRKPAGQ